LETYARASGSKSGTRSVIKFKAIYYLKLFYFWIKTTQRDTFTNEMHVYRRIQNVGGRNLFWFQVTTDGDVGFVILKQGLQLKGLVYFPDDLLQKAFGMRFRGDEKGTLGLVVIVVEIYFDGSQDDAGANNVFLDSFEFAIRRHDFVNRDVCQRIFTMKPAYFFCQGFFLGPDQGNDGIRRTDHYGITVLHERYISVLKVRKIRVDFLRCLN
jgi:hypothetical protein